MGIGRQCAAGTPAKGQTRCSAAPSCAPAGQPCAPAAAPAPAFDLDDDDDAVSSVPAPNFGTGASRQAVDF